VEPKVLPEGAAEDCPPGKYAEMTVKDNGPGIDPGLYDETGLHVEDCRNHTKTDGSKK
jgi:hypothetical protein